LKAIDSGSTLNLEQVSLFKRIMKWEIDALADELKGTADTRSYPSNLTCRDHYAWIPKPTLVYEISYPENETIDWHYVGEKIIAIIGLIFVMVQLSQHSICKFDLVSFPACLHLLKISWKIQIRS
jgi:sterol O-acyltransferase